VLEGGWVIILELDDFLLAFLYKCVRACLRGLVMLWYLQQSDSGRHTAWQSTRLNKQ
jgi:hypothetical protein